MRVSFDIEFYRDRSHVAVFGFFEGSLVNWVIVWGTRTIAGRFPRRG